MCLQAKPRGAWVPEQKQFRWELSDISPGASLVARVAFPPEPKQADIAQGAKVGAHLVCVTTGSCFCQCFNERFVSTTLAIFITRHIHTAMLPLPRTG